MTSHVCCLFQCPTSLSCTVVESVCKYSPLYTSPSWRSSTPCHLSHSRTLTAVSYPGRRLLLTPLVCFLGVSTSAAVKVKVKVRRKVLDCKLARGTEGVRKTLCPPGNVSLQVCSTALRRPEVILLSAYSTYIWCFPLGIGFRFVCRTYVEGRGRIVIWGGRHRVQLDWFYLHLYLGFE
jgi:hypothetical protein